ncbi:MAG: RagB/SusD family nutrient uptake outer membrane protein [Tannerella sp.]|jgi:hypothetical protein|nr:RagB/SusD family nutrient uptake outer membrane protein [Tannerella sp.]
MNKIKFLSGIIICMLFSFSCDDNFLDRTPDNQLFEGDVFSRYDMVDGMVTALYDWVKPCNRPLIFLDHFSISDITDECSGSGVENAIPHQFHIGNWGPFGMPAGTNGNAWWAGLYEKIRLANLILEGVEKYQTPDNPRSGHSGDLEKRIGEVYFYRAYLHWLLVREYGECMYVNHVITPGEEMNLQQESVHSVVQKITADCDEAVKRVAAFHPGDQNFGRVDKGTALGLKAVALWYAATPMWNGGAFPNDTRTFKSEYAYDVNRWEEVKKAAKAVLDLKKDDGTPRYSFYTRYAEDDFRDLDGAISNDNMVQQRLWQMNYDFDAIKAEWVLLVTGDLHTGWCGDMLPPSLGGPARNRPVQEQVDEYEIIINGYGYPIYSEQAKGVYDDGNPYVNRDPRFYRDIAYHSSRMSGQLINTAEGPDAVSYDYQANASHTGYYLRKFIKEGWTRTSGGHKIHGPALIKYPTIIYIYAEAVNNTSGPNEEIYSLINQVRQRVFMAPMPPEVKTNKTLMNDYIQRERRVELFYENDRAWRCRLYLEPDDPTELAKEQNYRSANDWPYPKTQRMVHGMRPVEDPQGKIEVDGKKYRMERFKAEDRLFQSKHYLFPLMDSELRRCPELKQNPGW